MESTSQPASLYARTYVEPESRKATRKMAINVQAAFKDMVLASTWIDKETKKKLQEKIDGVDMFIAYPDKLTEKEFMEDIYNGLEMKPG